MRRNKIIGAKIPVGRPTGFEGVLSNADAVNARARLALMRDAKRRAPKPKGNKLFGEVDSVNTRVSDILEKPWLVPAQFRGKVGPVTMGRARKRKP